MLEPHVRVESHPMQFRLAGVYGPQQAQPPHQATPAQDVRQSLPLTGDTAPDSVHQLNRVVAGVVPGRIDFSGDTPQPAPAALPLYRHPAERNVAATGVALGRTLDMQG
jgi:hypothetical protein